MATLDVRRHTMRAKPSQHLSQSGIDLARHVGAACQPFDLVVTSEKPRAIETAIAMGFAVNRQITELGRLPDRVFAEFEWPQSLASIAERVKRNKRLSQYAGKQAGLWSSVLDGLSGGQSGLVITHGAIIELGAIGFLPDAEHAEWGAAIGYCEGFRITRRKSGIVCEVLRVPPQFQSILN